MLFKKVPQLAGLFVLCINASRYCFINLLASASFILTMCIPFGRPATSSYNTVWTLKLGTESVSQKSLAKTQRRSSKRFVFKAAKRESFYFCRFLMSKWYNPGLRSNIFLAA
jgi:hypothetical protein